MGQTADGLSALLAHEEKAWPAVAVEESRKKSVGRKSKAEETQSSCALVYQSGNLSC